MLGTCDKLSNCTTTKMGVLSVGFVCWRLVYLFFFSLHESAKLFRAYVLKLEDVALKKR